MAIARSMDSGSPSDDRRRTYWHLTRSNLGIDLLETKESIGGPKFVGTPSTISMNAEADRGRKWILGSKCPRIGIFNVAVA